MLKAYFIKSFLLLFALAPLTGCMTSPGAWEHIGSKKNPYFFSGFMTGPNEEVYLYAKTSANQWDLVGKTTSSSTSIKHFGLSWYSWNIVTTLPDHTWHSNNNNFLAVVQARDKDGKPLRNWFGFGKWGFYDYFLEYDNLLELWRSHGDDEEIMIIADE